MPVQRSCLIKAMVFPVVMCGCESWTIEKAECRRIDAFELWCWTTLLRVSSTVRRSNQSILKEISPEYSAEGLMLKLKLQYFGHLMQKNWLSRKDPHAGKDWRWEEKGWGWDGWWHHRLGWTWVWASFRRWWWTGRPGVLQSMGSERVRHDWATELNWTYLSALQTSESVMLWERNALRSELRVGREDTAVIGVPFTAGYFSWFYIRPHI